MRPYLLLLLSLLTATSIEAQVSKDYYSSLKGKNKSALKTAIYDLIKHADVLEYGSGSGHTWDGFYTTDRLDDNSVVDRYSNEVHYFGSKGSSVSGMNIEHSFPKSWWGGSKNQAYQDLYNLMPCETSINSAKSNYPMGEVTNDKNGNGCTKVGTGSNGYQLWEPADKWKGDFARGYMYMATAYQNFTWSGTQAGQILETGDYPTLQKWAYTLYIKWAKADQVDQTEITRNNAVSAIQGNRNPYVDFPNLMEYVWGDSTDYEFDPETSLRTFSYDGSGTTDPTGETIIYEADYTSSEAGCTIEDVSTDDAFNVWQQTSDYGWKASGYYNKTKYDTESLLVTPEIDLDGYTDVKLQFTHAVNYCASPADVLAVEIRSGGQTTVLDGFTWGTGSSWTFKNSGDISLDNFSGQTIQVVFHYKSSTSEAATWEVKNIEIRGTKSASGITTARTSELDANAPATYFTIDGRQLREAPSRGVYIVRQNGHSWKMLSR